MQEKLPRLEQNRGEIRFRVIKPENLLLTWGVIGKNKSDPILDVSFTLTCVFYCFCFELTLLPVA